jgi:hypothetical protein
MFDVLGERASAKGRGLRRSSATDGREDAPAMLQGGLSEASPPFPNEGQNGGHSARCAFAHPTFWIVRSSRTMTVESAALSHDIAGKLPLQTQLRVLAASRARDCAGKFRPFENRGRGECRAPSAPAAPCALGKLSMHTGVHSGGTRITRHSRTRMVLTVYGALSPATNSSCHRRRRIDGLARPVGLSKTFADLTPATGARTTRFCRPRQCRSSCMRQSLTGFHPPCDPFACTTSSRPPHPTPTFVTIASRPSSRGGMAEEKHRFLKNRSEIFFGLGLDDPITLNRLTKSDFTRTRFLRLESLVSEPASTKSN